MTSSFKYFLKAYILFTLLLCCSFKLSDKVAYNEKLLLKQREFFKQKKQPTTFSPLSQFFLAGNRENFNAGKKLIAEGKMGCLVLAGGQGTRLEMKGPKGCAVITPLSKKSLFQLLCEKCKAASLQAGRPLQLAIMTSPCNHEETIAFFKKNNFFGLKEDQINFFPQSMLPFLDDEGNWLLSSSGDIIDGPDGNGSAVKAFYRSSIAQKWKKLGIDYVNVVVIDNCLADPFDAEICGFADKGKLQFASKAIFRTIPEEKLGVYGTDGKRLYTIEYSELPEEEKKMRLNDGSLYWKVGNLSLFCFSLDFLLKMGADPAFELPWHIAYKKADEKRFAWKFETFLFDAAVFADHWGVLVYPRETCFAPLKSEKGEESFESVHALLTQRERKIYQEITGKEAPENFELDLQFYYPTEDLLKR